MFLAFLAPHLLAALYSPIQDCDEVFNYWEPTHYLNHGYGLQTWEYSPEYAIRSWTYAGLHALVLAPFISVINYMGSSVLDYKPSKPLEFYALRTCLAVVCAACETRFFYAVWRGVNGRVAGLFMLILMTSTGMFHASTAYLPSSFAMYTSMLGAAAFIDRDANTNAATATATGIMWFAVGALIGWPFAGALILPFALLEVVLILVGYGSPKSIGRLVQQAIKGGIGSILLLAIQTGIDSYFYQALVCVPWNIVAYNVLHASSDNGPNIYGTEPWHFYLRKARR